MSNKMPVLTGSQDLLAYFNLIPIYNKEVKPYPVGNRTEGKDLTLFPYIADIAGKLDFEPDGYLLNLLRDPQAVETGPEIKPLDLETLRDAFSLKEGPVPGFDASVLGTDEGGYGGYTPNSVQNTTLGEYYSTELDHNGERRHKKKKKKRRHEEDGHGHSSDHKKKKKKKRDKERRDEFTDEQSAHYIEN